MKHAPYQLLLACLLVACNPGAKSSLSESSDAPLAADAPVQIEEADYENQFNSYVLPLVEQGETGFFTGVGGKNLYMFKLVHPQAQANVVVSHGYGESILKYRETIYNLYAMGYSVFFWEHRGHAHSDRLLADRYKTHVENFNDYVTDMETFVSNHVPQDKPLLLFAHSLGAGIALAYIDRNPGLFQAAVLNGPLLDLNTEPYPSWAATAIANVLDFVGRDEDYAPGQKPLIPDEWTFEKAPTSSRARFDRNRTDALAEDLALGGVTVKWLRETLKTTKHLTKKVTARSISTPILMFQNGLDTYVKPAGQDRFCSEAPACTLIKVPAARHEAYNETDSIRLFFFEEAAKFYVTHL